MSMTRSTWVFHFLRLCFDILRFVSNDFLWFRKLRQCWIGLCWSKTQKVCEIWDRSEFDASLLLLMASSPLRLLKDFIRPMSKIWFPSEWLDKRILNIGICSGFTLTVKLICKHPTRLFNIKNHATSLSTAVISQLLKVKKITLKGWKWLPFQL